MSVAQVGGLVALAGSPMPTLSAAAGAVASWAAAGLVATSGLVDWAPALAWRVPPPPAWLVAVYYASLTAAVMPGWRGSTRIARAAGWGVPPSRLDARPA